MMRVFRVVGLVLLSCSAWAAMPQGSAYTNSVWSYDAPNPTVREAVDLGVCAHVTRDEFADRVKTYEMAKAAEMDMIRTDFDWSQCQPKMDGEFNFGRFDQIVDDAKKAGVKILPLLGFPPQWAQPDGSIVRLATCAS